jgi:branched-subunit amino acid transport protein
VIAVVLLAVAALATWVVRVALIAIVPATRLPARLTAALDDVAPAALAALVVTSLVTRSAPAGVVGVHLAGVAVAAGVAWWTRSLAWTVVGGVGVVALLSVW